MTMMLTLRDWQNFYLLTGTAAATLIGLLFVGLSISVSIDRLTAKQISDSIRTFVTPTLISYIQVLLLSCLSVMPLQSPLILSAMLAVQGSVMFLLALSVTWNMLVLFRETLNLQHWLWHVLVPLTEGILFLLTSIGFLQGNLLALAGLAITNLLCLALGLRNSWVLTIWLVLTHRQQDNTPHSPSDGQ